MTARPAGGLSYRCPAAHRSAGRPRAFGARDVAVRVEFGRALAEVPDVAFRVLAVPIGGALLVPAAQVEPVADGDTWDAVDPSRPVRDEHHVACRLGVLDARVDVAATGPKRKPHVVDVRAEA